MKTRPDRLDIKDHWAEDFIRSLVAKQIIQGFPDGRIQPDGLLTRAQYAVLVRQVFRRALSLQSQQSLRSLQWPSPPVGNPIRIEFDDVPADHWAARAIAQAHAMGLLSFVSPLPGATFQPDRPLSRLEAITSLMRGLGWSGGLLNSLMVFRDRAQIPSTAAMAIATATQYRLVVRHPSIDRLQPMQPITRAEMAAMLYQVLVALGQVPAIASPYVVSAPPTQIGFADIHRHWAAEFIRRLVSQGMMAGMPSGRFEPEATMSRVDYAMLLTQVVYPQPQRPAKDFSDGPADEQARMAIQQVYCSGLMSGFDDHTFQPDQPIFRSQVWLSLVQGLQLPPADPASLSRFRDAATIPVYLRGAIASALAHGLLFAPPPLTHLAPARPATRAEIAATVYQALVQQGRSPQCFSSYWVNPHEPHPPALPDPAAPIVIVIDPGHGGTDPGAMGLNGLCEKDIVLALAQQVTRQLRDPALTVLLTRSDDASLDLEARYRFGQQVKADVWVSLHANVGANGLGGKGIGATGTKGNGAEANSLEANTPTANSPTVQGYSPSDMQGVETYHDPRSIEAARLAQAIHRQIVQTIDVIDRGVKSANFYLLWRLPMPAVSVEVGYITHLIESVNLANPAYQRQIALAIATGIQQYVQVLRSQRLGDW